MGGNASGPQDVGSFRNAFANNNFKQMAFDSLTYGGIFSEYFFKYNNN